MEKIGKYKVLGLLGKGGMGIVYKALDPDIERDVAIKTIRFDNFQEGTQKDDLMARFIREARAAGKLNHPNIVTVYDVGREEDLTYIVMQYIEGQSLQALIDSGKRLSPPGDRRSHETGRRRLGLRPQQRHRPPRHQAGQYPDRQDPTSPFSPISASPG